jgi:hypothetical protein
MELLVKMSFDLIDKMLGSIIIYLVHYLQKFKIISRAQAMAIVPSHLSGSSCRRTRAGKGPANRHHDYCLKHALGICHFLTKGAAGIGGK